MGGWGGVRVCSLGYQHPDADAKTAQTAETIRRRWERWKRVPLLAATVAGGRPRPGVKREGGGGKGYETAGKAAAGALASVKKCYEMEIPAGGSRRPARGSSEPPGLDLQPLKTQPNTVGIGEVRRRVTPPTPLHHPRRTPHSPTLPKTSRHFPLVSAGNQTPPPSVHPWPEPVNFCKNHVLFYLFPA